MRQVEVRAVSKDDGLGASDEEGQRANGIVPGESYYGPGGAGGEDREGGRPEKENGGPRSPGQTFHGSRCG